MSLQHSTDSLQILLGCAAVICSWHVTFVIMEPSVSAWRTVNPIRQLVVHMPKACFMQTY